MTYDENEDYNGPDVHRRGPFLFMAAIVGVILVAGFGAAVSDARADPNSETVLPADGVLSITRAGDVWSVTTDGIPSEVKLLSPRNEVLCGVNYGIPCSDVTRFTSTGDCMFMQFDGIPGWNSSDPLLCIGGTPSTSTSPAPTPSLTITPTESPSAPPTTTTPATQSPSPSPTPTSSPTSTPESNSNPNPSSSTPTTTGLPTANLDAPTGSLDPISGDSTDPAPARLADTGRAFTKWDLTLLMGGTLALAIGLLVMVRRTHP